MTFRVTLVIVITVCGVISVKDYWSARINPIRHRRLGNVGLLMVCSYAHNMHF